MTAPAVKTQRPGTELRNEQRTAEHGHILHEMDHLYLLSLATDLGIFRTFGEWAG